MFEFKETTINYIIEGLKQQPDYPNKMLYSLIWKVLKVTVVKYDDLKD